MKIVKLLKNLKILKKNLSKKILTKAAVYEKETKKKNLNLIKVKSLQEIKKTNIYKWNKTIDIILKL